MASLTTFFTTQHLPSLQTTAAPVLATTLGLLGFGGGLCTYLSPSRAPARFGMIPPTTEIQSSSSPHDSPKKADQATLLAYVRMHGARNATYGFVVVTLSLYALYLATRQPLGAAAAVRKCVGIVMLASVPVLTEDGSVLAERVKAEVVGGSSSGGGSGGSGGDGGESRNESESVSKKERQEGIIGGKISNDKDKNQGVGHLFFGFLTALVGLGCLLG